MFFLLLQCFEFNVSQVYVTFLTLVLAVCRYCYIAQLDEVKDMFVQCHRVYL